MRRRFGRRRWRGGNGGEGGGASRPGIDPSWLARVAGGLVDAASLEPVRFDDIPDWLCVTGVGEAPDGSRRVVALSPSSGAAALLGAIAAGLRVASEPGFRGRVLAVAPSWRETDRRLLGLVAGLPFELVALAAPGLGDERAVEPEAQAASFAVPPELIGAAFDAPAQRALFERGLAGLRGLAAKHGGVVRSGEGAVELVLLARPVASLRAGLDGPVLEALEPSRTTWRLEGEDLADALDRLEGQLRKYLSDRRIREGDEGLRGAGWEALAEAVGARHARAWPVGGEDCEAVDFLGVDPAGAPVVGALRRRLDLAALAGVLEAALRLEPALGALLAAAVPPLRLGAPSLALAAGETSGAVDGILRHLSVTVRTFAARESGGRVDLTPRTLGAAAPATAWAAPAPEPRPLVAREPEPPFGSRERSMPPAPLSVLDLAEDEARNDAGANAASEDSRGRPRRRRRGRRSAEGEGAGEARGDEPSPERSGERPRGRQRSAPRAAEEAAPAPAPERAPRPFLEVSLFDLDEESGGGDEARGRRRRRRGGRRGRRDATDDSGDDEGEPGPDSARPSRAAARAPDEDTEEDDDGEAALELSEAPELEVAQVPAYEEGDLEEAPLSQTERLRLEREDRRRAQLAEAAPVLHPKDGGPDEASSTEPEAAPELPRGRAAVLAHADRASIASAVLLAREMRSVEGIWIYPQADLMTFFRSVATDLRPNTPIFVVGFEAKPSHDALQAASLYAGRIVWFDHREWPPEDLHAMRLAIGAPMLHVTPGTESPLAAVLTLSARRSRFSDKLVDLVNGRFSLHDWERWGRLWWHRLGELAGRTGDHRADVDALLVGRPSDLSREASRAAVPPAPPEAEFAASRDFPLVHFGGYGLVLAEVPAGLDPGLTARVLRERFAAALSLTRREGSETVTLGAEEDGGRALDLGAMVDHLAEKLSWVDALSDADHVARFRIRDLERRPERLDEAVAEIGMSRGVLEG